MAYIEADYTSNSKLLKKLKTTLLARADLGSSTSFNNVNLNDSIDNYDFIFICIVGGPDYFISLDGYLEKINLINNGNPIGHIFCGIDMVRTWNDTLLTAYGSSLADFRGTYNNDTSISLKKASTTSRAFYVYGIKIV